MPRTVVALPHDLPSGEFLLLKIDCLILSALAPFAGFQYINAHHAVGFSSL